MTSMEADSVATILCSSKQTRFNIALDIDGLNIIVTSGPRQDTKGKGKAKKSEGTEILNNAKLRLKAGQRYALLGRNGTGKSTLLKAIAEKLIPGIPEETRIVILQQTNTSDVNTDEEPQKHRLSDSSGEGKGVTVLEEIIERATSKQEVQREINVLSNGIESGNSHGALRAFRKIRHDRLQKELFQKDKDARLRSGARGLQARKALTAMEKKVVEFRSQYEQEDEAISAEELSKETSEAADMLEGLQLQVEPSKIAEVEAQAKKILTGLGFSDQYMQKLVSSLSGGWKMHLLIINNKDLAYFHGDLPMYEASQSEKKVYLTKMKEAQDKQKEHIQQTIQHNMREGKAKDDQNKIRQAKSRQKKLDDRWGLEVSAKGGRFKLNRDLPGYHLTSRADIDVPQEQRPISFVLPQPPDLRFPGPLLSLEKVSFRYPRDSNTSRTLLTPIVLKDITLSVNEGDRIGILGLNGSGKSTLIKLLVEETRPTAGTLTAHPRLKLGYYSQHAVETLQQIGLSEPSLTALALLKKEESASPDQGTDEGALRSLLGSLGLPGRLASDVPVRRLSGGQLVRLEVARILRRRPHLLVLDEPTTHLDYETVAALRRALRRWEGAVVLASHDRWFVRGVVEGLGSGGGDGGSDGEDGDGDGDDEYEEGAKAKGPRRRVVYRLRGGQLTRLEGGVEAFVKGVLKRVPT
ncbi:putative abc transporter protein [Eutypa lata UCREL1]|uniref:Putative abc transporter protein n=1 Tax=Eutypa lata (strain UCR-EL1) TaxID=1287681 RepID=M7SPJ5_EUTLA|nr:putative abc transporter protein [Eutypa lata UCREL1]